MYKLERTYVSGSEQEQSSREVLDAVRVVLERQKVHGLLHHECLSLEEVSKKVFEDIPKAAHPCQSRSLGFDDNVDLVLH